MPEAMPIIELNPPAEGEPLIVEGEVVTPRGAPLPNYPVRASDRGLCEWRSLGEARTNDLGRYRITYDPAQLKAWGKVRADLKAEVYDAATSDTVLASSPLIFQAPSQTIINFSVGDGIYRGPDEYTHVSQTLAPLLEPVRNLTCLNLADVLILARDSHLNRSAVACYIKAQRWSAELDAPAAMFYGLLRQHQPAQKDALFARPFSQLWTSLEQANAQNISNVPLGKELKRALGELQQRYLSDADHPYHRLLETTNLSGEQQGTFTGRLMSGSDSGEDFWHSLESEAGFTTEQVADLRSTFELQSFTGGNTSLSVHLRAKRNVRKPREAAVLSAEDWESRVLTAEGVLIPDSILFGEPEADRRAAYAEQLYRSAELRYPTPSMTGQMARSDAWTKQPVFAFLQAYPDFEFDAQRLTPFLQEHPEIFKLFPNSANGAQDLLRLEQLFHLTPSQDRLAAIGPMWDAGLRSAPQIAMAGRQQLLRQTSNRLAKPVVNLIYQQAVHITAVALNVYLRYHPRLNSVSLYALRPPQLPKESAVARAAADLPEWSELFGSTDSCECSHCQSTLSPGAYLVDMMDFLQRATDSSGKTALDHLLERRPDLGVLQLTCENAENELPQIDLMIETMEQIVANSSDGKTVPATGFGQTTWDSELLAAQPEHVEPAAYEKLREANYPFGLPFDFWLTEGRRYLKQMGVARYELMEVMPLQPGVGPVDVAAEELGMSPAERPIIIKPLEKAETVADFWGIDMSKGPLVRQLRPVETLLNQANLDYNTLLRVLNTRYLNPDREIAVEFKGEPCSLDGAELNDAATLVFFDRLHRFLRLQRKLGWSEYELDGAIRALGVADFDDNKFLLNLAAVQALHSSVDLTVDELCAWWAGLDTYVFEEDVLSQYEAVFLDPAVFPDTHTGTGPDLRNEVFALATDRSDLAITVSTDPNLSKWLAESDGAAESSYTFSQDYAAYIESATRLTADDILLLVDEVLPKDAITHNVALNLANVSLLYRVASFTRALDLTIRDYLRLNKLTGIAPLTTSDRGASPIDSTDVQERAAEISANQWSIEELAYLLVHDIDAAVALVPTQESMDLVLTQLSAGFSGIADLQAAKDNADLIATLTQSVASTLGLDSSALGSLLFAHRTQLGDDLIAHLITASNPELPSPPAASRDFYLVYETLHKFSLAWKGLDLDSSHLAFVLDQGPLLGWTDPTAFPLTPETTVHFESWRRLTLAATLQASVFSVEQSLFGLLSAAQEASLSREEFLSEASQWTLWNLDDLVYLAGADGFNFTYPDAFRDERWLAALKDVFTIIRPLGVSAGQAHTWTVLELGSNETESMKQALKLAYASDVWLTLMAGIQDELRILKRDALLAYLLVKFPPNDTSAFHDYYLMDPGYDACAKTSRIVEAHLAVQLFAQRILLNLEQPLAFAQEDAKAWEWRKNYRVWEAARKVFLYPENWLEPELRDDKSVFFRELEDGLSQGEVNLDTAERLYREYLVKLDEVSRLEIMGMYQDEVSNILHVVGRTKDVPPVYYYRRWEDQARWTPWERVPLDISADHLVPIVYNGRLYLFWPDFKVTNVPKPADAPESTPKPSAADEQRIAELKEEIRDIKQRIADIDEALQAVGSAHAQAEMEEERDRLENEELPPLETELASLEASAAEHTAPDIEVPLYDIELGMAWSQLQTEGWSPKTLSKEKASYNTDFSPKKHAFTGWVSSDNRLHLTTYTVTGERLAAGDGPVEGFVTDFYFNECGSQLHSTSQNPGYPRGTVYLVGSYQSFQSWDLYISSSASLEVEEDGQTNVRDILREVPVGAAVVHYAHQYGLGGRATSPFFYSDDTRTYFVEPLDTLTRPALENLTFMRVKARHSGVAQAITAGVPRALSSQPSTSSGDHFSGVASDQVVTQSESGLLVSVATASQNGLLTDILAEDAPPVFFPAGTTALTETRYQFTRFYHPYTCLFLKQLSRYGVEGLLNPDKELDEDSENLYRQLTPLEDFDFKSTYEPESWVRLPFPDQDIDFDQWSTDGFFNWELFFHIPLLIATRLMQNQRYDEARSWFHYIFDPTCTEGEPPARFWKTRPFYEEQLAGPTDTLADLMDLLKQGSQELEEQVEEWEADPFQPDVIARLRTVAYMQTTVMKYLDCLIGQADLLFTMDDRESINRAAQLYLLAGEILGDKPVVLPAQEPVTYTPNELLGRFDIPRLIFDPLEGLTSLLPTTLPGKPPSRSNLPILTGGSVVSQGGTTSYGTLLLFCIPPNDKLSSYWDTVADRLVKIRHCMNIAGEVRQLPLLSPPIDPGLLIRAVAAGLDISSIISNFYAPLPHYRFAYMMQKASEFCGDVRSLGAALLSALEKADGEGLALLRSSHETSLLKSIRMLKQKNVDDAKASLEGLQKSQETAQQREAFYSSRAHVSRGEQVSLDKQQDSRDRQRDAEIAETTASILHVIPYTYTGATGIQPTFQVAFGGPQLGSAAQAFASYFRARAAFGGYEAGKAATMAGYDRRQDDWDFQAQLAKTEIEQLDKQMLAAEIRQQIAELDLENHDKQIAQAEETDAFLKMKFTNQELYNSTVSTLSALHFTGYQMAYQLAKQAEKTFQHELGPDENSRTFILPTYWDSLKKGLLASEQLHMDLRRMETAHLDANRRELEITKHVSLFQLDPNALLEFRETGICDVHIPEVLFDMDYAGHYYRRIKALRITIPCVTGPYTSIGVRLRLISSWIRKVADITSAPEQEVTILPQMAIAANSADRDGGAFELNFNDQRYLPFEGAGAVSSWRLELPSVLHPFDYDSITDVVLHVSYTARDGGDIFREAVNAQLESTLNDLNTLIGVGGVTFARLISLRQEFSAEWNRFLSPSEGVAQQITVNLSKRLFPRYLDNFWEKDTSGGPKPSPITLRITSTTGYLNPKSVMPSDAASIQINGVTPTAANDLPMLLAFNSGSGLSGDEITNAAGPDLTLTVNNGQLRPEDWKDLSLLMGYEIIV